MIQAHPSGFIIVYRYPLSCAGTLFIPSAGYGVASYDKRSMLPSQDNRCYGNEKEYGHQHFESSFETGLFSPDGWITVTTSVPFNKEQIKSIQHKYASIKVRHKKPDYLIKKEGDAYPYRQLQSKSDKAAFSPSPFRAICSTYLTLQLEAQSPL